jgi:signal transduction histidine kinase
MHERLWIRIAVSFLLFLVVGTVGLILVLTAAYQRLSRTEFVALAQTNAEFIRTEHLPQTDRFAAYLSRVLGVEVHFDSVTPCDARHEAVSVAIEPGAALTLIRERPTLRILLLRPVALGAVAAFWGLWVGLAWAVVRPYLRAQRLALLGGIATSLAHEIRNPIAAIRLHGQLIEQSQHEAAELIVSEAAKIEDLVNQWMFLARPEPPKRVRVDLASLLAEVVHLLAPAAEHASVRIAVDVAPGQCVMADSRRLSQVFHNIVMNAIQAMPTGGTLSISAREGSIRFADTGPGFSHAALAHWAEILFSEKEGGMGIGLSVAKEIVQAHGGRLSVSNQPQGGALIHIQLSGWLIESSDPHRLWF